MHLLAFDYRKACSKCHADEMHTDANFRINTCLTNAFQFPSFRTSFNIETMLKI